MTEKISEFDRIRLAVGQSIARPLPPAPENIPASGNAQTANSPQKTEPTPIFDSGGQLDADGKSGAPEGSDAQALVSPPSNERAALDGGTPAEPDSEQVQKANASLGVGQAIFLLQSDMNLRDNFPAYNIRPSRDNRRWNDNGSLRRGDTVELYSAVYKESRIAAAKRIAEAVASGGDEERNSLGPDFDPDDLVVDAEFPVDAFPEPLRSMIKEVSILEKIPHSLPGSCGLSALSGAMGSHILIPSKPGKVTTANTYVLVEAESGDGKSSAAEWMWAPIEKFQAAEYAKFLARKPALDARLELVERELKDLNKRKLNNDQEREDCLTEMTRAKSAKAALMEQIQPPAFVASNTTSAALADLMSRNGGMMMSFSSDARAMAGILMGRYESSGHTDDELYLQAYSVTETCRTYRITREPVILKRPCLAISWSIQDDMYAKLWDKNALVRACHALWKR